MPWVAIRPYRTTGPEDRTIIGEVAVSSSDGLPPRRPGDTSAGSVKCFLTGALRLRAGTLAPWALAVLLLGGPYRPVFLTGLTSVFTALILSSLAIVTLWAVTTCGRQWIELGTARESLPSGGQVDCDGNANAIDAREHTSLPVRALAETRRARELGHARREGYVGAVARELSRPVTSVLVFIDVALSFGVLGTLLGLIDVFAPLADSTSSGLGIGRALGGMQFALGASVVSVGSVIAARLLHSGLHQHRLDMADELEEFVHDRLARSPHGPREDPEATGLDSLSTGLDEAPVAQLLREILETIAALPELLRESTAGLSGAADSLADTATNLGAATEQLDRTIDKLRTNASQIGGALDAVIHNLKNELQAWSDETARVRESIVVAQQPVRDLHNDATSLRAAIASVETRVEHLQSVAQLMDARQQAVLEQLAAGDQARLEVFLGVARDLNTVSATMQAFRDELLRQLTAQANLQRRADNTLESVDDSVRRLSKRFRG